MTYILTVKVHLPHFDDGYIKATSTFLPLEIRFNVLSNINLRIPSRGICDNSCHHLKSFDRKADGLRFDICSAICKLYYRSFSRGITYRSLDSFVAKKKHMLRFWKKIKSETMKLLFFLFSSD